MPPPPTVDLRAMVRDHIARQCCRRLEALAAARREAFAKGQWQAWRDACRQRVANDLGPFAFAPEVKPTLVSRHELDGYVIENVLFESLPGWEVNASVFLPDPRLWPPPWPGIVVPVGHSGKHEKNYQFPCQAFARMGYAAITFDPPGMSGEKQGGNDHFIDGVRCYLTGWSSNRYFVADALRCIDYLAGRPDIDSTRGVGMTGVSGGGYTTMFATLLDDRITAAGPACTAVPNARHPVLDAYAPCAETLPFARFDGGYDDADLLAAIAPTPLLLMAGATDEVFRKEWSDAIAADVREAYANAGMPDRFAYHLDPGGHGYTLAMAAEFVMWMDSWVRKEPGRQRPALDSTRFEPVPSDMLACRPNRDVNIFSLNRDRADSLRNNRSGAPIAGAAAARARVNRPAAPEQVASRKSQTWFHWLEELLVRSEPGIELPVTLLYPTREGWHGPAVVFFDERGRWTELRKHGPLAKLGGFTDEACPGPAVMAVDLRGWGDCTAADGPYDLASWGGAERWIAFVSAALGDPITAMRIRDGLAATAYLRARPEFSGQPIVVGGYGMGAVIALHVAAIEPPESVAGCFGLDGLATFDSLARSPQYAWSPEDFLPGVLLDYDLPELAADLARRRIPVLLVNPLDAMKQPIQQPDAAYPSIAGLTVRPELAGNAAWDVTAQWICNICGQNRDNQLW